MVIFQNPEIVFVLRPEYEYEYWVHCLPCSGETHEQNNNDLREDRLRRPRLSQGRSNPLIC